VCKDLDFSIIIPAYNISHFLRRCVESVVCQSYNSCEILIIDDGSTDDTGVLADQIEQEYQDIVRVVHQENRGLGGARNTGIEMAQGKYIVFVDSDDYIRKDLLKIASKHIFENDLDVFVFGFKPVYDGDEENYNYCDDEINVSILDEKEYLITGGVTAWNKIYKKCIFIDGNIRFPEKKIYEDVGTTPKIAIRISKVGRTKTPLYYYYQRDGSIINTKQGDRIFELHEGFADVINYFNEKEKFNSYRSELEFLGVIHVLYYTVIRVLSEGYSKERLRKTEGFLKSYFLEYKKNMYISNKELLNENGIADEKLFRRIVNGHYFFVYLRYFYFRKPIQYIKKLMNTMK